MNSCLANPPAPLPIVLCCWLLESLLAKVVCFFDALERLIPPFVLLVTTISLFWAIHQQGWWAGLVVTIPLGLSMALTYGIIITLSLFLIGVVTWLLLIPFYWLASSCQWRLPTVLEQNSVVSRWLRNWPQGWEHCARQRQPAVLLVSWFAIGVLLGCWLEE